MFFKIVSRVTDLVSVFGRIIVIGWKLKLSSEINLLMLDSFIYIFLDITK